MHLGAIYQHIEIGVNPHVSAGCCVIAACVALSLFRSNTILFVKPSFYAIHTRNHKYFLLYSIESIRYIHIYTYVYLGLHMHMYAFIYMVYMSMYISVVKLPQYAFTKALAYLSHNFPFH